MPFISEHKLKQSKPLGAHIKRHSINGDGNCLFRALSFGITGRQTYYRSIRQKIVSHMKEIEFALQPHINCPLEDYLLNSKMASDKTWGTDIYVIYRLRCPDEKNCARGLENGPSPKGEGRFQHRGHSFSHSDRSCR